MQQPQRARVLHVGIPAALTEQRPAPAGGHAPRLPPSGVVRVVGDQPRAAVPQKRMARTMFLPTPISTGASGRLKILGSS